MYNEKRAFLKSILKGNVTRQDAVKALAPSEDVTLLTPAECNRLNLYKERYAFLGDFEQFTDYDLLLYLLIVAKATPDSLNRHMLDGVELTALNEKEVQDLNDMTRYGQLTHY